MVMQVLYKKYSLFVNYFYPSKKIVAKTRDENGRTYKKYDIPKTPFTRSLEFADKNPQGHITKDDVERMQQTKQTLDIITLQRKVTGLQRQLFKLAKRWNWPHRASHGFRLDFCVMYYANFLTKINVKP